MKLKNNKLFIAVMKATEKPRKKLAVYLHITYFNYIIMLLSLFFVFIVYKYFPKDIIKYYIDVKLGVPIVVQFVIGFLSAYIMLTTIILRNFRKFLGNFSSKSYIFMRPDSMLNDLKFVSTWLAFTGIVNIIVKFFIQTQGVYNIIAVYLVQNLIFYLMVKKNFYNYKISRKDNF
ncbi:hypothetical protein H1Q59_06175 [Holosporaceae bacterium 'Namur']|nr:hypothetical protein [Holosporaceae bacterium 'Namur']